MVCTPCHRANGAVESPFGHTVFFPLAGGPHAALACSQCHPGGDFAARRGATCITCHGPQHGGLVVCTLCHRANGAVQSPFGHTVFFPLAGGPHAALACAQCHPGGDFVARRGATCTTCHGLGHGRQTICTPCHTANGAVESPFDHRAFFPLAGGPHAALACAQCHPGGDFVARRGATCVTCHGPQHGGLVVCTPCHRANGAVESPFDHTALFPLAGGPHAALACAQCHPGGNFVARRGATCTTCHGLGHGRQTICTPCHGANGAVQSPFDHRAFFPLAGGPHAALACSQCHPGGDFVAQRGATCTTCHGPQHGGLTTCVPCHSANGTVDHTTFFELVGAHTALACSACHGTPFHKASGTHCVDCHGIHHGDQRQCDDCHTTIAFVPTKKPITHPAPIELGVQHSMRSCRLCHTELIFSPPTRPCSECHTPPHVGPDDCLRCHMPTVWTDLHFTHPAVGPHSLQEFTCTQCHVGFDFTIPRAQICITCHW